MFWKSCNTTRSFIYGNFFHITFCCFQFPQVRKTIPLRHDGPPMTCSYVSRGPRLICQCTLDTRACHVTRRIPVYTRENGALEYWPYILKRVIGVSMQMLHTSSWWVINTRACSFSLKKKSQLYLPGGLSPCSREKVLLCRVNRELEFLL